MSTLANTLGGQPSAHDPSYSLSFTGRGNPTQSSTPGLTINTQFDVTGTVVYQDNNLTTSNLHSVSLSTSSLTNFTLPDSITPSGPSGLTTMATYGVNFFPTSVITPYQATSTGSAPSTSYDVYGRVSSTQLPAQTVPGSSTTVSGATTTYSYSYGSPWTVTATTINTDGSNHCTVQTLDGIGRVISVVTGSGCSTTSGVTTISAPVSEVDTQYKATACAPLGKLYKRSQPYCPSMGSCAGTLNSAMYTTYSYDALGRTTSVQLPDNSTTTYLYQGNVTTITDPAKIWKQYAYDVFGNLVTVLEPDPSFSTEPAPPTPVPSNYPLTAAPNMSNTLFQTERVQRTHPVKRRSIPIHLNSRQPHRRSCYAKYLFI